MSKKKPKPIRQGRMISVPTELNARMAKHADENWSAIACRAFESRLGELAAQKQEKNMDDVVARLRASKHESDSQIYLDGKDAGEDWAKETASAAELKRLSRLREKLDHEPQYGWEWFFDSSVNRGAFSPADHLAFAILGDDDDRDREDSTRFWETATGWDQYNSSLTDDQFLRGFAEGALEIWEQVAAKL